MRIGLALLIGGLMLAVPVPALAQPAGNTVPETIIVNGRRVPNTPNAIAHEMIRSFAAPSVLLNQIPRWRLGVCPRTDGLSRRNFNDYVTARIRAVAALAGAPVKALPCKPNLEVVFTDDPQRVLDWYHKTDSQILGYHGATLVSHPIQVWYETGTTDINGQTIVDQEVFGTIEFTNGGGLVQDSRGRLVEQGMAITNGIPHTSVEGWKGRPEVMSDILGALIIADTRHTASHKLGAIADYIAMLALSKTDAFQTCQIVPSIANEMADGCDAGLKPDRISISDIGYLRGVYKMDQGASLQVQQDQIAGEMVEADKAASVNQ
jgi:hypothetical protein